VPPDDGRRAGASRDAPPAPLVPSLEVAPLAPDAGRWRVAASNDVAFSVTAPRAESVRLLYRPVTLDPDRRLLLRRLDEPTDREAGTFSARVTLPEDFAGVVWAEATYSDGVTKATEPMSLTADDESSAAVRAGAVWGAGADESDRSDRLTGGRIEKASFSEANPYVWITLNLPAFRLTLWQDEKEVAAYPIGIGRKAFPVPVGEREARRVIFNPAWIPPDSTWVDEQPGVEPGERIEADDPRNPLGTIKIPLGDGILIHEAASPSDVGSLVSHGCVRMLERDIFELAERLLAARSRALPPAEMAQVRRSTERKEVDLGAPVRVDINYDTQVVEGGALNLYPDVYDRATDTVRAVREELGSVGFDASRLDDETIRRMLGRVSGRAKFAVELSDLMKGHGLAAGSAVPLATAGRR
jgi:hypothetical protein